MILTQILVHYRGLGPANPYMLHDPPYMGDVDVDVEILLGSQSRRTPEMTLIQTDSGTLRMKSSRGHLSGTGDSVIVGSSLWEILWVGVSERGRHRHCGKLPLRRVRDKFQKTRIVEDYGNLLNPNVMLHHHLQGSRNPASLRLLVLNRNL